MTRNHDYNLAGRLFELENAGYALVRPFRSDRAVAGRIISAGFVAIHLDGRHCVVYLEGNPNCPSELKENLLAALRAGYISSEPQEMIYLNADGFAAFSGRRKLIFGKERDLVRCPDPDISNVFDIEPVQPGKVVSIDFANLKSTVGKPKLEDKLPRLCPVIDLGKYRKATTTLL